MHVAYLTEMVCIETQRVIVPVYNRHWLRLTVHHDCVSGAVTNVHCYSNLYAFCLLLPLLC